DPTRVKRTVLDMEAEYTHKLEERRALLRAKIEGTVARWEESGQTSTTTTPHDDDDEPKEAAIHDCSRASAAEATSAVDGDGETFANPTLADDDDHSTTPVMASARKLDTQQQQQPLPPPQTISASLWEAFESLTWRPSSTSARTRRRRAAQQQAPHGG
ncbi:hypothetical protein AC579_2068, partial [Pseudocercospora musae]